MNHPQTPEITDLILKAAQKARAETSSEPEPELARPIEWPIQCTVGPGLEGAISCETKIGYVNGSKGWLIYRGYDIFELCAHSTFEEVSFLLLHGNLPTPEQLERYKRKQVMYRPLPKTLRKMMSFSIEEMSTMAALRVGTMMMRQAQTYIDSEDARPDPGKAVDTDADSIPMETKPRGEKRAIYEFKGGKKKRPKDVGAGSSNSAEIESAYHLISGMATLLGAIARLREGKMPIEPDPELSHAANLLYLMTGKRPSPIEERLMDISLILHADHGMNASTFATMVVASTLSDIYFSVGAGIAALNGPLHGGANEQVLYQLEEIGSAENVPAWFKKAREEKTKIMGFGHRVYKAYDPRARVLGPLAKYMGRHNREAGRLCKVAFALEKEVVGALGASKGIFPNVDFFSGIVYRAMGIPPELYTPIFAASRVSGWVARTLEYLEHNRIFRPRAMYTGEFDKAYVQLEKRKR